MKGIDIAVIPGGAPKEGMAPAGPMEPDGDEFCVPVDALAMPDEQEQMTPPEVGDPVTFQVDGKVTRIEGGKAYIDPTAINGKDVSEPTEEAEPTLDDQKAALGDMAAQIDAGGGM